MRNLEAVLIFVLTTYLYSGLISLVDAVIFTALFSLNVVSGFHVEMGHGVFSHVVSGACLEFDILAFMGSFCSELILTNIYFRILR